MYRVSSKQGHKGVKRWSLTLFVINFIQAMAGIPPGSIHICPQGSNVCVQTSAQSMDGSCPGFWSVSYFHLVAVRKKGEGTHL